MTSPDYVIEAKQEFLTDFFQRLGKEKERRVQWVLKTSEVMIFELDTLTEQEIERIEQYDIEVQVKDIGTWQNKKVQVELWLDH